MAAIRRTAAGVLFLLGVASLLLLNVRPFNNAIACINFWTIALLLLLPEKRRTVAYALFAAIVAIAATLPRQWERQQDYNEMRERLKQMAAEA